MYTMVQHLEDHLFFLVIISVIIFIVALCLFILGLLTVFDGQFRSFSHFVNRILDDFLEASRCFCQLSLKLSHCTYRQPVSLQLLFLALRFLIGALINIQSSASCKSTFICSMYICMYVNSTVEVCPN